MRELTEAQKWEKGRFVEVVVPNRGTRLARVIQAFAKGSAKEYVRVGLFNPYTGQYGNRGGYRGYVVRVLKKNVVKFFGKSRP